MSKHKKVRKKREMDPAPSVLEDLEDLESERPDPALEQHGSTGHEVTGGDLDASWESAESVGDEAPGGHMPTPDQDIVDNLGRAVGLEFPDATELHSSEEILADRDRHRWELDPGDETGPEEVPEVPGGEESDIIDADETETDEPES